jgi:hypothetical protein
MMAGIERGAVAFSKTGDPQLGEWNDAVILGRYADVPDRPRALHVRLGRAAASSARGDDDRPLGVEGGADVAAGGDAEARARPAAADELALDQVREAQHPCG